MNKGIDKELVLAHYQKLTDNEIIKAFTNDVKGLTVDALEIVKDEIKRRDLNTEIIKIIEVQQETYTHIPKAYDPDGCGLEEDTRLWLENSFIFLLNQFGKDNTVNRKILTPCSVDFPIRYDGSEESAFKTLRIIAQQMEVPVEQITLDFYDENIMHIAEGGPGGLYWGKGENDKF